IRHGRSPRAETAPPPPAAATPQTSADDRHSAAPSPAPKARDAHRCRTCRRWRAYVAWMQAPHGLNNCSSTNLQSVQRTTLAVSTLIVDRSHVVQERVDLNSPVRLLRANNPVRFDEQFGRLTENAAKNGFFPHPVKTNPKLFA